jgi:hypothetical protein
MMGPRLFLLGCGGGDFLVFFPCSHQVPFRFPNFFPKAFPISPQFYPIWFAQSSTLMYINWKGRLLGSTFFFILQLGGPKRCFHWGVLNIPKKLLRGQWRWLFQKNKKKLWGFCFFFSQVHGRGGSFVFCLLPTCSQCGPIKLPRSSHQVPKTFPKFPMSSLGLSLLHLDFYLSCIVWP